MNWNPPPQGAIGWVIALVFALIGRLPAEVAALIMALALARML